jgi:hypothetical protein
MVAVGSTKILMPLSSTISSNFFCSSAYSTK